MKILRVAFPPGIGDTLWLMTKMQSLLEQEGCHKLDITVCNDPLRRSEDFLRSFTFVNEVHQSDLTIVQDPCIRDNGHWNYFNTQKNWNGFDWLLQCNEHLENGDRLEDWHPEWTTNWSIFEEFVWEPSNFEDILPICGPYCVFYFGPEMGNTTDGHNKGPMWKPEDWKQLQQECGKLGLNVIAVGAYYDASYFNNHMVPLNINCFNYIGRTSIQSTLQIIKNAKFVVGYQSGITISAPFLNVPAVGFWRPTGNTQSSCYFVSFDERMANAWVSPEMLQKNKWLGAIYGKDTVESIINHIKINRWIEL